MPAPFRNLSKQPPRAGEAADLPLSQLGTAATVTGVLDTDGELQIHGSVVGRINAERLVLCRHGQVEGDIVAKRRAHRGAPQRARLRPQRHARRHRRTSRGAIFHNTVTVARGARFEGRMPWRPPSYFETLDQLPETRP